jgi:hypothetical protein
LKNKKIRFLTIRVLPVLIGAVAGFSYYYFIGCKTGSCPISGSPYISTLYGAVIGLVLVLPGKKRNKEETGSNEKIK